MSNLEKPIARRPGSSRPNTPPDPRTALTTAPRAVPPRHRENRMTEYERDHRNALARELTYAAGCPLRDRYGFAASDETVAAVVAIVFREPDDAKAADAIGMANVLGDLHLAMGYDTPTDEEYERAIVAALRPLVEQRRDAAVRSLG